MTMDEADAQSKMRDEFIARHVNKLIVIYECEAEEKLAEMYPDADEPFSSFLEKFRRAHWMHNYRLNLNKDPQFNRLSPRAGLRGGNE